MRGLLLTVLIMGLLACGDVSPHGITYTNEGSWSDPIMLLPDIVYGGHVGEGTSYYYALVSPSATYTVTVSGLLDNVLLRVRKGSFSSPIECESDTGGSKEECSVTLFALQASIYIHVINNTTVLGTPYTISVHKT